MNENNEELPEEMNLDSVAFLRKELAITADKEEYKFFCTQYVKALERWHTAQITPPKAADNGHWFGKLIAFPYLLVNFENSGQASDRKPGQKIWDELRNGVIKVTKFQLTGIDEDYKITSPQDAIFKTATVVMSGVISYEKKNTDGTTQTVTDKKVKILHNLEQTWYANDSTFELIP